MDLPKSFQGDRDKEYEIPLYVPKVVQKTGRLSKEERLKRLREVGFNVFSLKAEWVSIDLLTDSGTGSISDRQLAAMMLGDESYAGATSFYKMKDTIKEILGFDYVVPAHQGRGAERIQNLIMTVPLVRKEKSRYLEELNFKKLSEKEALEKINAIIDCKAEFVPEVFIPGNTHFDTTEGNIEFVHAIPLDLTIEEAKSASKYHPFKGNIDVKKLKEFLADLEKKFGTVSDHVPFILITITCNSGGGQPVSMDNIIQVRKTADEFKVPLFFDAARYAENAFFIKEREEKYKSWDIKKIIQHMFNYADGCLMSSKKDAIVPMGGFIALRDKELYEMLANANILFEGYKTYGGISGLMMEALTQGLRETADFDYLKDRVEQVRYLGNKLKEKGIPIVEPVGGHAVFVDARRFYEGIIPEDKFPAQALTAYLYLESGVRAVEIGSCLKGRDPITGENKRPALDLMRLTIPRRKYAKQHMDVVIKALDYLYKNRKDAKGLEIIKETEPKIGIRHFTVMFKVVGS